MKISLILTFLILAVSVHGQIATNLKNDTKKNAERVWELAIQAQGGRDKLLTMKNLVISSTGNSRLHLFKKQTNLQKSLYVFPNKMWAWEDHRPTIFGVTMRMYNWETGKKYVFSPSSKNAPLELAKQLKPIEQIDIDRSKDRNGNVNWTGLVIYLLESKWWKPVPEALTVSEINGQKVDVVQTVINGKRTDFFFNQKDHLPIRISFYNFSKITNTNTNTVEVSEYTEINGFKVPAKLIENDGKKYDLTYQFNVEYNEDIFKSPPTFESGSEAWKVMAEGK